MRVSRRALVLGVSAVACSRREQSVATTPPMMPSPTSSLARDASSASGQVDVLEWTTEGVSTRAAIIAPRWGQAERMPVLVALHGRGEAVKPPREGALGWPRDYALVRAIERVCSPPLTDADYEGLSDPERLQRENERLAKRPFGGLVVVCPHVPDLDLKKESDVLGFGRFLIEVLLPRVRREARALDAPESTGIDGVSLGGHLALRVGLTAPEQFGAVGALQAAIDDTRVQALTDLALAARSKRPKLALRLTTSHDDYYAPFIHSLDDAWTHAGVAHDFGDVPGPHDYPFNRGPGAYEMLLWHDRTLARG